jgi:hemoglobin
LDTSEEDLGEARPPTGSLYDRVGGESWFVALVVNFYGRVENDPVLRPLYPEDLANPRKHLTEFLVQRFGGPNTYSATRGHPRLRMRHSPFAIGMRERDAWIDNMTRALHASGLGARDVEPMLQYFEETATMLVNR